MADVKAHTPGDFCWAELATTDQDAAKKFYTSVFDWAIEDVPLGDQGGRCQAGQRLKLANQMRLIRIPGVASQASP